MKIGITGTHGTGKSTLAYKLANRLKRRFPNKSIYILQEIARECPFPINKKGTLDSQVWLLTTQLVRELELSLCQYDIVITDRCIVDPLAYAITLGIDVANTGLIYLVKTYLKTYDYIYLNTFEDNNYSVDDGVRECKDNDFRIQIEINIVKLLLNSGNCNIKLSNKKSIYDHYQYLCKKFKHLI